MDMQNSIYSEFGPDGLRFLKDGIKVSKEGLSKVTMLSKYLLLIFKYKFNLII